MGVRWFLGWRSVIWSVGAFTWSSLRWFRSVAVQIKIVEFISIKMTSGLQRFGSFEGKILGGGGGGGGMPPNIHRFQSFPFKSSHAWALLTSHCGHMEFFECREKLVLKTEWVKNCWWGWQNETDLGKCTHQCNETQGNNSTQALSTHTYSTCRETTCNFEGLQEILTILHVALPVQ